MRFDPKHVYIAVTMSDGECKVMSFITRGRGNVPPSGGRWVSEKDGIWEREPTDENIFLELSKWPAKDGEGNVYPTPVRYRRMSSGEDPLKEQHYRGARVDDGRKITYDAAKLRECHRNRLRQERVRLLHDLDGQWMRATGQGKKAEADAIEERRQKLRDVPADSRIETAVTLEQLKAITL